MPVNWYVALVVIVIVGIGSVAFARYNYGKGAPTVQPVIGQTWHAALSVDVCGTVEPVLPASSSTSTGGLTTSGSGVLLIAPKTSAEAGHNATLGKFASEYSGFTLTNKEILYPGKTEYKAGDPCAKGTPDAGQKGELKVRSWLLSTKTGKNNQVEQTGGATSTKPADLRLANRQLITVGYVPAKVALPKPPGSTTVALLSAIEGTGSVVTTTTTAPSATTTTTAPTATTTTTTKPTATTTTTKPATTTTAAKTTTTSTKAK
ncbi:MAG TPA: hypothetical protein VGG38_02325 [Acidimicrobiales bacterium]|jgi:hypothetical protein